MRDPKYPEGPRPTVLLNSSLPAIRPRVCSTCHGKLWGIVKLQQFYCRNCGIYISILGDDGKRIGPGINPTATEEEIKAWRAGEKGTRKIFKVMYKLVRRPSPERKRK